MSAERNRHLAAAMNQDSSGDPSPARPRDDGPVAAARVHLRHGRTDKALEILAGIFPEGRTRLDLPGSTDPADAILLKAWCHLERKDHQGCLQWLDRAKGHGWIDQDHPGLRVVELNLQLFREEYAEVQAAAEQILQSLGHPADLINAELRLILGAALRWQGRLEEAVSHVEFACSAFTVLGEDGRTAVAANFLGWTQLSRGRLDEARRWFEKSLDLHSRLGASLRMAQTYQNLAIVCYKQGDYDLGVELLQKELKLVADHPDMTCRARIALGNILRLKGEPMAARSNLLEAYSLGTEHGFAREEALALEFLGDVFRDEGSPLEARRYYQRGLAVARALAPRGDLVMEIMRREGECLDLEGRHEEAHFLLADALEMGNAVNDRFEIAVIRRCLGVCAANLGRWKLAARYLREAIKELRDMRGRHETMLASWHLARVLLRQIDSGNAGAASGKLLEEAWTHALLAQQLNRELETPVLAEEIGELVMGMARRRMLGDQQKAPIASFSTRRAPTTRVIAVSGAFRQVLQRCDGFSRYKNPVLIEGESGTGKELLARRIHENSPRGASPFVRISCAGMGADVLAREVFGVMAGAVPHVTRNLPGLVSQAEGGTLLLAGIEELPRELQGHVLRLIQEGIFRPVGDSREHLADVRVIVTSEADLSLRADQGYFRPDLYFRLRQMAVRVPALRHRPEDVVPLLEHFLTRLNGSTLNARDLFDLPGMEALTDHHWPGNVAEVEAIAHQAWLNRDLGRPVRLRRREAAGGGTLDLEEAEIGSGGEADGHQSGMTWTSLNALIERAGGNKARVARNLGISRITLYRWLKQLDPESA